ncbi:DUF2924 domain-containing protein [Sphingomonas faeni]|uniref:DUF2924 domain-containing protein n=1 Tax=Sphingomonas faeni TaxID=185950 RepID=UPI0033614310
MTEAAEKRIAPADTPGSVSRWEALFECPAPQRLPGVVEQAVAWRDQVLLHGDIPATIAHDLQLAAEHALQRRGVNRQPNLSSLSAAVSVPAPALHHDGVGDASPADALGATSTRQPTRAGAASRARALPPAASQLLPGSQLIKAHGGRNHVVGVEADGFRYEGELFSSLSAIAKHITGTHWNGLLFFGLRKRRSYPPTPRRHG